jgi:hypothetical protein
VDGGGCVSRKTGRTDLNNLMMGAMEGAYTILGAREMSHLRCECRGRWRRDIIIVRQGHLAGRADGKARLQYRRRDMSMSAAPSQRCDRGKQRVGIARGR